MLQSFLRAVQSLSRKQMTFIYLLMGLTTLTALGIQQGRAQQINVKSDMSNAVQNIGEIRFAPGGIRNADPSLEVVLKSINGVLTLSGNVLVEGAGTLQAPAGANVTLVGGTNNRLFGAQKSAVIGGNQNRMFSGENNAIVGGAQARINTGSKNSVIAGGYRNEIKGDGNVILAGEQNEIVGSHSTIAGGQLVKLTGDHSFSAGANIQASASESFIWSDSYLRSSTFGEKKEFSPTSGTFAVRAENGIGVNTANPKVKGMDVNGLIHLSYDNSSCSAANLGAITYLSSSQVGGNNGGCFCECSRNTSGNPSWRLLSRKNVCIDACANAR